MKLTLILLTAALCAHARVGLSQSITYTAKNVSPEEIMSIVKQQAKVVFIYKKEILRDAKKVNITAKAMPLQDFLDMAFKDQPFTWSIQNQTVVLESRPPNPPKKSTSKGLDSLLNDTSTEPIRGVVKDSAGMPMVGATVTLRSTKRSVQTNAKGEFIIEANIGDELVISYIGYQNLRMKVSGNRMIAVLFPSTSPLDVVQVQAYGTTSRRLSTGNITTIKSEEIARQNVTNPLLALQGRVPNLVITPANGLPGAAVKIQLRGQNSLARGVNGARVQSEPLIVIDGVPYTNNIIGISGNNPGDQPNLSALRFLNPADIEQIDVLSDADATSIYGSRGGNGVILITTKRGKAGATNFRVDVSSGWQSLVNKLKLMNTQQYLEMRREAYRNDGLAIPDRNTVDKNLNNYDLTVWDTTRYTDWQKVFLQGTARTQNAYVSVSGGNASLQYFVSGTYTNTGYVFPGKVKDETMGGSFSLTGATANNRLRVSVMANYNANTTDKPGQDFTYWAVRLPPNAPPAYNENGMLNWEPIPGTLVSTWKNPFAGLAATDETDAAKLSVSSDISYKLFTGLTLKVAAGINRTTFKGLQLIPLASKDPATLVWDKGRAFRNYTLSSSWTVDPQISYSRPVAQGKLDVLIGSSFQKQTQLSERLEAIGYTSDALIRNLASAASFDSRNQSSDYKYAALFGRVSFNWDDKYLINLNARRDGSSRFGPGNQFGNFASVGAAWIFSNENFWERASSIVSSGKIRGSYGSSGNDGIGNYGFIELYTSQDLENITYQGMKTLRSAGAINPYYHWEDLRKSEIGLDLGFFKDRILVGVSYWRSHAYDQLGDYPLPATAGNTTIVTNRDAQILNTGWAFTLFTKNIATKNFRWTSSANFGLQYNKVLSLPDKAHYFGLNQHITVGEPFSDVLYVYDSKGVNPATGLYQFVDQDGNVVTLSDLQDGSRVRTNATTVFTNNTFSYKGFSLSVDIQITKQLGKNYIYDYAFSRPGSYDVELGGNVPVAMLGRWQKPGDITNIQRFTATGTDEFFEAQGKAFASNLVWVDASFLRVRNLSLSYILPKLWTDRWHMQDVRILGQVQNLLTITGYEGLDPEIQSVTALPLLRSASIGINVGF